ncbi:MAG: hypothetical protein WAV21_03770 [Minisyncoccia bacterium]
MQGNVILFFGIVLFVFILWAATGGPSRQVSWSNPYIAPLAYATSTNRSNLSQGTTTATRSTATTRTRSIGAIQRELATLQKAVVTAARFGPESTYKGLITIQHSTGNLGGTDPEKEYITLRVSNRVTEPISITGWHLESAVRGYELRIPLGVALPHTGNVDTPTPITVAAGQSVIILMGESPIGISFQENMCTGYFDQFQDFYPSLSHQCPAPLDDFDRFYYDQPGLDNCRAYIKTLKRCEIPLDEPERLTNSCYRFMRDYLSYNSCVATHATDQGFPGKTWRVYLRRDDTFFTATHDTIKLLDEEGKTVDLFSY